MSGNGEDIDADNMAVNIVKIRVNMVSGSENSEDGGEGNSDVDP
jgi:hypothetical protein